MRFDNSLLSAAEFLGDLYTEGFEYIAYQRNKETYQGSDIYAFSALGVARRFAREKGDWIVEPMGPFIRAVVKAIVNPALPEHAQSKYFYINKEFTMNKMNLENLQGEMRSLKFDEKTIELMEREMAKGQPNFQLSMPVATDKGQMEAVLNFKKSTSSEYYFLNKYDLAWSKAKPLEEGRHYFVISPNPEKQNEHLSRKFDSVIQAMDYFKAQKGSSELAMGKTAADKMTLATMSKGAVDYVTKDFRGAFYAPLMTNSVFVDKGRGFTVEQATNMFQGRSVFREDMLNISNERYSSWNRYLFEEAKDRFGNYKIRQYNQNYGFDLKKDLEGYRIKELEDPKKLEQLMDSMKNGNRPLVTVTGEDGKEQKLRIEAMPRYGNFNFYELGGNTVKREQFQKNPSLSQGMGQQQVLEKKQNQQQAKGMAI